MARQVPYDNDEITHGSHNIDSALEYPYSTIKQKSTTRDLGFDFEETSKYSFGLGSTSFLQADQGDALFNDHEKLYLVLLYNDLVSWFNILCYECNVNSITDLKIFLTSDRLHKICNPQTHKETKAMLENVLKSSKNARYRDIVQFKHLSANNYKDELRAHGIKLIEWEDITVQRKIASKTPFSGTIFKATWTKPNGGKVTVCLQYPCNKLQLEMFLSQAKSLNPLKHENIICLYGVIVLGPYVNSVALVVEFAPMGNLMETMDRGDIISVRTVYSYACQMASALEYIAEGKTQIITTFAEYFIYVFPNQTIKFGGASFCYTGLRKNDVSENYEYSETGFHEFLTSQEIVYDYGGILRILYKSLPTEWSSKRNYFHPKEDTFWKQYRFPDDILELIEQCMSTDEDRKLTIKEIVSILEQRRPVIVAANRSYDALRPIEMSYKKGERITVMSKKPSRFMPEDLWFGQKEDGTFGFFNKDNADETTQDEPQEDRIPAEIIAQGPEAENVYRKALLEGKPVEVYRGRIMLIGQDRAGKTSLKKSLLGLPFDPEEPSTEGIEVDPSTFEVDVEQVKCWQRLCDMAEPGSPSERALAKLIAEELSRNRNDKDVLSTVKSEEAQVIETIEKLQVDVGSHEEDAATPRAPETPEERNFEEKREPGRNSEASLTESPKLRVKLSKELVRLVTEYLKSPQLHDRQKGKESILDIWDFAGQHLYYATHPVFFSSRAIYILTHNLSKGLLERAEPRMRQGVHDIKLDNHNNETNLENLVSWLVTVHGMHKPKEEADGEKLKPTGNSNDLTRATKYLRPPVVVVGTHFDKSSRPISETHALLAKSFCGKAFDKHVIRPFFVVDNNLSSEDTGVQDLKAKIAEVLESEPYMGEPLPAKWFHFEKAIGAHIENKTYHMTLREVKRIAQTECFIEDEKEVETMLDFYHDLRTIVKHGTTVVLQSQWLINVFKKLITVRMYKDMHPLYGKYWKNLEETGILDKCLIDHVFGEIVESQEAKGDLLSMMEHYGFLAKFKWCSDGDGVECCEYFVPAQLTSSPSPLVMACPKDSDPCPLLIHFPVGFVPHGLFAQLISRLMRPFSEMGLSHPPNLHRNAARFVIGKAQDFDLTLLCGKRYIKVVLRTAKTCSARDQTLAIRLRMLLEDTLEDLSREWEWLGNVRTELCVTCLACAKSEETCDHHGKTSCSDEDCVHIVCVPEQDQPLVCTRIFDDSSRYIVPGLEKWFKVDYTVEPEECIPKIGCPSIDDLTSLAREIGPTWKRLGRALGLDEPELDQLDADERLLYECCYGVLRRWTQIKASKATYESLGRALIHDTVLRFDLAAKYCGVARPFT